MPSRPYRVVPYSIGALRKLLAEFSGASEHAIAAKMHQEYFREYFDHIKCATIVVESEYVDRDYLEDFADYYVRCFQAYARFCARLHFFSSRFDEAAFEALLRDGGPTSPLGSYHGFVVIKPLPATVVGRSCLSTYPDGGGRHYPATRDYDVDLFGIALRVHTLAFQEQDQVAAACATSALWSAFQATAKLFQHPILSPVRITAAAAETHPHDDRVFPNHGLTVEQMAAAVRVVDLEPCRFEVTDPDVLLAAAYSYLKAQIPAILVVELVDTALQQQPQEGDWHAVAVTGFRMGKATPVAWKATGMRLSSSRIDRLYVHDDQVGPFARMVPRAAAVSWVSSDGSPRTGRGLSTSWRGVTGRKTVRAIPRILLVPLYHKVRIQFDVIQGLLSEVDELLELGRSKGWFSHAERVEWDIHLSTVTRFKQDTFMRPGLDPGERVRILSRSMPRFLWRASARTRLGELMELVFDATDIKQAPMFLFSVSHSPTLPAEMRAYAIGMKKSRRPLDASLRAILNYFAQ